MPYNATIFNRVNKKIADDIKSELRYQGHYDTGELEESIEESEELIGDQAILSSKALIYIEELEKFTPPEVISKKDINIGELADWCLRKGLAASRSGAIGMAKMIIKKWKKEGKPLESSKEFSLSGEITDAIKTTFELNDNQYYSMIDEITIPALDSIFHTIKSGTI